MAIKRNISQITKTNTETEKKINTIQIKIDTNTVPVKVAIRIKIGRKTEIGRKKRNLEMRKNLLIKNIKALVQIRSIEVLKINIIAQAAAVVVIAKARRKIDTVPAIETNTVHHLVVRIRISTIVHLRRNIIVHHQRISTVLQVPRIKRGIKIKNQGIKVKKPKRKRSQKIHIQITTRKRQEYVVVWDRS